MRRGCWGHSVHRRRVVAVGNVTSYGLLSLLQMFRFALMKAFSRINRRFFLTGGNKAGAPAAIRGKTKLRINRSNEERGRHALEEDCKHLGRETILLLGLAQVGALWCTASPSAGCPISARFFPQRWQYQAQRNHAPNRLRHRSYFSSGRPKHSTYPLLSMTSKARRPSPVLASSRCMGTCLPVNSLYSPSGSSVWM